MKLNLFILIAFASLAAYAFVEKLYFSGTIVLLLAFSGIFIRENIDTPLVQESLTKKF
jgi:hypothetical protein